MSRCLYLSLRALHKRIPSIIEAWFNASLIIASSSPNTVCVYSSVRLSHSLSDLFSLSLSPVCTYLEQAAVSVPARSIDDGVFGVVELAYLVLQLLVYLLH